MADLTKMLIKATLAVGALTNTEKRKAVLSVRTFTLILSHIELFNTGMNAFSCCCCGDVGVLRLITGLGWVFLLGDGEGGLLEDTGPAISVTWLLVEYSLKAWTALFT